MTRKTHVIGFAAAFAVSIGNITQGEVGYPSGIQDFEALTVGADLATALPNWVIVNTSAPTTNFTMVIAEDVMGNVAPRCQSTRWLRSTDIDGGAAVQNRYYSPEIIKLAETTYRWTWWVNLETTPPGGADTKPKLTIQHRDTTPGMVFANAWGIEFTNTGANLIVLGIGGVAASAPLYPLSGATAVGQWVKLDLVVDFGLNTVSATADNGSPVSLPINLNGDQNKFRFCYRGEGMGNIQTMVVDDIAVCVGANCPIAPFERCPTLGARGIVAMAGLIFAVGGAAVARRRHIVAQAGV